MSDEFEQKNMQLQAELEKLKAQTEVELRAKQLKDLAQQCQMNKITTITVKPTKDGK